MHVCKFKFQSNIVEVNFCCFFYNFIFASNQLYLFEINFKEFYYYGGPRKSNRV